MAVPGIQRVPDPRIELFILRDFLDEAECAALVARIEAQRRPSTIADPNGDAYFRTSETCDLSGDDPAVAALDARLAALSGIDPAHGRLVQRRAF